MQVPQDLPGLVAVDDTPGGEPFTRRQRLEQPGHSRRVDLAEQAPHALELFLLQQVEHPIELGLATRIGLGRLIVLFERLRQLPPQIFV